MPVELLSSWLVSSMLLGLRITPVFVFAPPFSLIRVPRLFHVLFGFGLAACLVSANPATAVVHYDGPGNIVIAACRELMVGLTFVLTFQLVFAALYTVGRTIDIQAGYGLAMLIDPTFRAQAPLVGTLFAYAAGAVFFAMDGHIDLLRLLAASLDIVPVGQWTMADTLAPLTGFISVIFLAAFGLAGAAILVLFMVDLAIAMLSRTVPQMNVLILGFQIKTFVLLLVLPVCLGLGGVLLARMMTIALHALPGLL